MGRKIVQAMGGSARGKTVALLGLTFKPNTDDMRDSPSLAIVQTLLDAGARVTAYDPEGMAIAAPMMPEVEMQQSAYAAADGAHAVAIVTEWDAFRALDFGRLGGVMADRLLVDLRNIYRRDEVLRHGFRHIAIGSSAE
jgi:UDPglucose 6-dehydrogenase